MAIQSLKTTLALLFSAVVCFDYSIGKSVVNISLSPKWRNELSKRASDYVQHTILPFVAKQLSDLSVPAISGVINTPLGNVNYDLKDIKVSNVVIQKSKVSVLPEHGLGISADEASGNVDAVWHYRESSWPHISDSGSCDLSITDLSLGMAFFVDGDLGKKDAKVNAKDCKLKIGSLHVKFKGGASWLYNLFADGLASSLKDQLADQICQSVTSLINSKATETLDTFPALIRKFSGAYME